MDQTFALSVKQLKLVSCGLNYRRSDHIRHQTVS